MLICFFSIKPYATGTKQKYLNACILGEIQDYQMNQMKCQALFSMKTHMLQFCNVLSGLNGPKKKIKEIK